MNARPEEWKPSRGADDEPAAGVVEGRAPRDREAYLAWLPSMYGIEGNPDAWGCRICGERTSRDDVLISYNVLTPIPYCPAGPHPKGDGYGQNLVPAPAK